MILIVIFDKGYTYCIIRELLYRLQTVLLFIMLGPPEVETLNKLISSLAHSIMSFHLNCLLQGEHLQNFKLI